MPETALRAPVTAYPHPTAARRPVDWRSHAACVGLPDAAVFARRPKDALPALRACAGCPVPRYCLEAVAPRESWFDGVCGGRLWRNGKEARIPDALAAEAGLPTATSPMRSPYPHPSPSPSPLELS
ncbi:WhiB family transcriptional regulator [Streptomyces abikoensis]|uniref:WhiB family transcriptional regulator n=1 Tax=Streptomyces abikoensis TaxID=97398 RepID=UPI00368D9067